jgi:hypothetical protein
MRSSWLKHKPSFKHVFDWRGNLRAPAVSANKIVWCVIADTTAVNARQRLVRRRRQVALFAGLSAICLPFSGDLILNSQAGHHAQITRPRIPS